jgi:hypothetical protein
LEGEIVGGTANADAGADNLNIPLIGGGAPFIVFDAKHLCATAIAEQGAELERAADLLRRPNGKQRLAKNVDDTGAVLRPNGAK